MVMKREARRFNEVLELVDNGNGTKGWHAFTRKRVSVLGRVHKHAHAAYGESMAFL